MATLNYDGLTHAGLLDAWVGQWLQRFGQITDLAVGYGEQQHEVVPGRRLLGRHLRDADDLLGDRAALVQLHGSLGWLRSRDQPEEVWKFELPALREVGYWEQLALGATVWEPVVVLTDRKDRAIEQWPFSLAYQVFLQRLMRADRWLVPDTASVTDR